MVMVQQSQRGEGKFSLMLKVSLLLLLFYDATMLKSCKVSIFECYHLCFPSLMVRSLYIGSPEPGFNFSSSKSDGKGFSLPSSKSDGKAGSRGKTPVAKEAQPLELKVEKGLYLPQLDVFYFKGFFSVFMRLLVVSYCWHFILSFFVFPYPPLS